MNVTPIIFDENERIRSGWRVAGYIILTVLLAGLLHVVLEPIRVSLSPSGDKLGFGINSFVSLTAAILAAIVCIRGFEKLPIRTLGISLIGGWYKNLLIGILVGGFTFLLAIAPAIVTGGVRFAVSPTIDPRAIAASFAVLFLAAAFEEVFFRGYLLQTFTRSGLAWLAIALTSAFFAVVHLSNPNANIISTANTAIAGVWFSIAYLRTRDLWLPFGIHFAWNFVQGPIFGVELSGIRQFTDGSILTELDNGPAWLTGGEYGIEASVTCTAALLLSLAVISFLPFSKTSVSDPSASADG